MPTFNQLVRNERQEKQYKSKAPVLQKGFNSLKKKSIDHTQLLLLKLLSTEDMYGYQIILELARRSSNVFEMKEGTLYPVLHGMEREGYVEAYEKAAPTGRMRKYYHLTRAGRAALTEEEKAWQEYSGAVNAVLHFA